MPNLDAALYEEGSKPEEAGGEDSDGEAVPRAVGGEVLNDWVTTIVVGPGTQGQQRSSAMVHLHRKGAKWASPCRTLSGSPSCVQRQQRRKLPAPYIRPLKKKSLEIGKLIMYSCFDLLKVEEKEKLKNQHDI